MTTVPVFASIGRFRSFAELRHFIDVTYTEDGDGIPLSFMREVCLADCEPTCIEAVHSDRPLPLPELLIGASYSDQWLPQLPASMPVDAAICVFEPNRVGDPQGSSLTYCGPFNYEP